MDIMATLARHVVGVQYDDLPHQAVVDARRSTLDTLGTMVAGATAPGCQTVVDLVREWGGKQESTILIHGGKVPALHAAMANSVMARALDFDNGSEKGMHPSASTVPTGLAMAERCGGASGKDFITAIAVGEDLASRINRASRHHRATGFDSTGICTVFGAAAIAGRLLGLDEDKMLNALGLAFNQASGSFQSNVDGSLAVRVIQGFSSRSGVTSAILAERGITAPRNVLQGIYGFFNLFSRGESDVEALTAQLGQRYEGGRSLFKAYPSCGATLSATQGALDLAVRHDIDPEDIDEVRVRLRPDGHALVGHPFEVRSNPEVDAQFSIAYTVANALVRRSSRLEHFTRKYVTDPLTLKIAGRVRSEPDAELVQRANALYPALVDIRLRDGTAYSELVRYAKGWPENPLTRQEIEEKFRSCVAFAAKPLPEGRANQIVEMVDRLPEVDNVTELVPLLLA